MTDKPTPYLALKAMMMPRDTSPYGTIFGGVLLSYIDQAGAVGGHHAIVSNGWLDKPLVTMAMNQVEFHEPVYVGDVLSFFTEAVKIGTTSITMHVTVEAERDGKPAKLTEAQVTYVAVDLSQGGRNSRPIYDE